MFYFRLLGLLLANFSTQAIAITLTWEDQKEGTGLHVFSEGKDRKNKKWIVREAHEKDFFFYKNLFSEPEVVQTMMDKKPVPEETIATWLKEWVNRFADGRPFGKMTIEQDEKAIGCVQLGINKKRPGVGEISRAFTHLAQGNGLGNATLGFLVNEWAPALRKIALNQDVEAPASAVNKFKCFGGEPLRLLYATSSPSNVASWKGYKHFGFHPYPLTDDAVMVSCEGWEKSIHGSLEEYITSKHFSPSSSESLQVDVLYKMLDEEGNPRTLSFVNAYNSLRYHFELEVK